jgi:hypothetical protein
MGQHGQAALKAGIIEEVGLGLLGQQFGQDQVRMPAPPKFGEQRGLVGFFRRLGHNTPHLTR